MRKLTSCLLAGGSGALQLRGSCSAATSARQRVDRRQRGRRPVVAERAVERPADREEPQVDRPLALDALRVGPGEAPRDVDAEERHALVLELDLDVEVDDEADVDLPQRVEAELGLDAETLPSPAKNSIVAPIWRVFEVIAR